MLKKYLSQYIDDTDELELVSYGLYNCALSLCGVVVAMILGVIFGKLFEVLFFLTLFIPLRVFAGGYHARSAKRCMVLSTGVIVAVILLSYAYEHLFSTFDYGIITEFVLFLICGTVVFLLSPVDNDNKRLFNYEIKKYKEITGIIVLIEFIIFCGAGIVSRRFVFLPMATVMFESISLVAGKIKNRIGIEKE